MGRIASTFKRLSKINEIAIIPRVVIGYPSLEVTRQLVPIMGRQGADLIELMIPESGDQDLGTDPLRSGVTIADCMSIAAEARRANEIPLIFRSHYTLLQEYGLEEFVA